MTKFELESTAGTHRWMGEDVATFDTTVNTLVWFAVQFGTARTTIDLTLDAAYATRATHAGEITEEPLFVADYDTQGVGTILVPPWQSEQSPQGLASPPTATAE